MSDKRPMPIEDASLATILKRLEELDLIANSGYIGLDSSSLLAGFTFYWGHRIDVARQSVKALNAGRAFTKADCFMDAAEIATLAFEFGVELGRLLAKIEYSLSPDEEKDLIESHRNSMGNLKNQVEFKEGKEKVISEARSYAYAYWRLMDSDKAISIQEMSKIVFKHLVDTFTPETPQYRHIADLTPKKGALKVEQWIKGKEIEDRVDITPAYAKRKRGRPPKNK